MPRFLHLIPLAILLAACPTPVVPPNPDASDASAFGDAPPTPCALACAALQRAGCVVLTDCATTLQQKTPPTGHLFRNPKTGDWLTCADLQAVKTADDARALGQECGP